ncbi:hypothetical protein CB0940_03755 [Cercospora beticola]|uniref:BTB domain-containing protein n=1 Tax=Cercospora beticola TaxID=122368 RepID=A0A2G5I2M4_CERBT|nr:hypothetical protein CB0940_03755 [Cercospora beticola]PIA98753.1 hypothetical protein CB0940_03755 [Cercospora beticola]
MSFDTAPLYNQPEYSDVTISFSGRSIYCHKVVLSTSSEYFKRLESGRREIELKEDDPDAVEFILEYLYSFDSDEDAARNEDWKLQLQVANAAHKASGSSAQPSIPTNYSPKHLHNLLNLEAYREVVDQDRTLLWKHLDHLNAKFSERRSADIQVCRRCPKRRLLARNEKASKCSCRSELNERDYKRLKVWVPKDQLTTYKSQIMPYGS